MTIRQASDSGDDLSSVRELFWEYLQWANARVNEEFEVNFDIESMLEEDMVSLEKFSPPDGRLLLVTESTETSGIGCLKRLGESVGEIKRMYIRPEFRGKGKGHALLDALIDEAKQVGYQTIRLDSAGFMKEAHSLYRSRGFREIQPYPESEIPSAFQEHWLFMEKHL